MVILTECSTMVWRLRFMLAPDICNWGGGPYCECIFAKDDRDPIQFSRCSLLMHPTATPPGMGGGERARNGSLQW